MVLLVFCLFVLKKYMSLSPSSGRTTKAPTVYLEQKHQMGTSIHTYIIRPFLFPSHWVLSTPHEDPTWHLSAEVDPGNCSPHPKPQVRRSPGKKQLCPGSPRSRKGRMGAGVSCALFPCSFHRKVLEAVGKQLGQGVSQGI